MGFMEAVNGCEKDIDVRALQKCNTCDGSGSKPGTKPSKCTSCGGRGMVIYYNSNNFI